MSTDVAQERLAGRIQELYASDPQLAAAAFDEAFSAAIERRALRLSQLVGSRLSRRPCADWPRWSPAGLNCKRRSTQ
ncbi:MAG: hypothetical protein WA290_23085 [Mycobacterium sp.]|uniref:hypothetical protein n=1 Tax=Mycobacterium sp. TaxID=1785 RepID=UPI003C76B784